MSTPPLTPRSDGELLAAFATQSDQSAFTELVARHTGTVRGACQRVLRNAQDAEDASQAAFMVLARKARTLVGTASIAGWLHQVARRTAMNLRGRRRETAPLDHEPATLPPTLSDLSESVDEELQRLPAKFREALLLCTVEGLSRLEAAQRLQITEAAVKDRLERAREQLRARLLRRGITLSAGFTTLLVLGAGTAGAAAVPAPAAAATAQVAAVYAAGKSVTPYVSLQVVSLADGVLRTMFLNKLKLGLSVCLSALTVGLFAQAMLVDRPDRFEKSLRGHVTEVEDGKERRLTVLLDEFEVQLNLGVAPDAQIALAFAAADFGDIRRGMYVGLKLGSDHRTVESIHLMGRTREGRFVSYNPALHQLVIDTSEEEDEGPGKQETFQAAPDVIARIDGLRGRPQDLEPGQLLHVELGRDGATVHAVSSEWRQEGDIEGVISAFEPVTGMMTILLEEDDAVVTRQILLPAGARVFIDGLPASPAELQRDLFVVARLTGDRKAATTLRARRPTSEETAGDEPDPEPGDVEDAAESDEDPASETDPETETEGETEAEDAPESTAQADESETNEDQGR